MVKFQVGDKVMRFYFDKDNMYGGGLHLIVAKLPDKVEDLNNLYTVKNISKDDNSKQLFLSAENDFRKISIPLDYPTWSLCASILRANNMRDEYDNFYGELGEGFHFKCLEDIYSLELTDEELAYSIRESIISKLNKLGYSEKYYHKSHINESILYEF